MACLFCATRTSKMGNILLTLKIYVTGWRIKLWALTPCYENEWGGHWVMLWTKTLLFLSDHDPKVARIIIKVYEQGDSHINKNTYIEIVCKGTNRKRNAERRKSVASQIRSLMNRDIFNIEIQLVYAIAIGLPISSVGGSLTIKEKDKT